MERSDDRESRPLATMAEILPAAFKILERRPEICPEHGEHTSEHVQSEHSEFWTGCGRCAMHARLLEPDIDPEKRLQQQLERAGVPRRFWRYTLADWLAPPGGPTRAYEAARGYVQGFAMHHQVGCCLIFCGSVGTGKTRLAVGVARALLGAGRTVLYTRALQAIRTVRDSWRERSERSEREVLAGYRAPDLLILDEVGQQYGTEGERVILTEIIGGRYDDQTPTLVISNEDVAGLRKYLGERAFDRLRDEGGRLVVFDWPSYRGKTSGDAGSAAEPSRGA